MNRPQIPIIVTTPATSLTASCFKHSDSMDKTHFAGLLAETEVRGVVQHVKPFPKFHVCSITQTLSSDITCWIRLDAVCTEH